MAPISFFRCLNRIISRETLMPPPVELAQAPTSMRTTSKNRDNSGHISKFAVENPVVVMIEDTWKKLSRNARPPFSY